MNFLEEHFPLNDTWFLHSNTKKLNANIPTHSRAAAKLEIIQSE